MTAVLASDRSSVPPDHSAFPALDGIRALAVTAVVLTHASYWTGRYERGVGAGLLARADVGVAVFFVLSGFLLFRGWAAAARTASPAPQVRVYLWRRALRVIPAYWLTVAVALLVLPQNDDASARDWFRHGALIQIYHPGWFREGLTQTWSLCTEVAFYLVLPLFGVLATLFSRLRGWRPGWLLTGCAFLLGVSIAWYVAIHRFEWAVTTTANFWLPGFIGWFAGGMALAVVSVELNGRTAGTGRKGWNAFHQLGHSPGVSWLMAAGLYVIAATPVAGPRAIGLPNTGNAIVKSLLYLGIAVLVVWPGIVGTDWANIVFGNRVLRWAGGVSYSVFLVHLVVLQEIMRMLGYPVFTGSAAPVFVLTLVLSFGAAALMYRFVEQPAMRLRRLIPPSPPRTSAPQSTAARAPQDTRSDSMR